jgi:ACS family hexuronate transporter-like MFS transporter
VDLPENRRFVTVSPTYMNESAPGSATAASKHRWVILALLFFATTINYIDRSILSLIKPEYLDKELGWTNIQYGYVNSAFQFAYAFGLLGFGWFIDRFGTKIGYAFSIVFWSVAAAGHALVSTVSGFTVARVFLGLGEGGNFPAAIKTVAQWFPRGERAFANALFNSGSNIGSVVAPLVVLPIAAAWGWRSTFVIAGAIGILWVFFWIPLFRNAPAQDDDVGEPTETVSWGQLFGTRQAWAYMIAKFMTDPVWWFYLIWLPDYFKKEQHLDLKHLGALPGFLNPLQVTGWLSTQPTSVQTSAVSVFALIVLWAILGFAKTKFSMFNLGKALLAPLFVCLLPFFVWMFGQPLVVLYSIVTVLSIFAGWAVKKFAESGFDIVKVRKVSMLIFAVCSLPIFFVRGLGMWEAVFLIAFGASAHQAWSASLYATVSDTFSKNAVASVSGMGGFAGSIGGMIFPIVAGAVLDANPTGGYAILFSFCAFAYVIAFAIHHALVPKLEKAVL